MASDGTRVFVLGGNSSDAHKNDISLIHVFDTKDIKYPEPEPRRVPEDNDREGSTEYHEKFAAHSSSEGEVTRLELERQLSGLLAAQTERDQRIARLTDELTLKSALMRTSLVKQIQREAELVDMHSKLLSRDQQNEKELMKQSDYD